MTNPLLKIRFQTVNNPPFAVNDELIVFYNDATSVYLLTLNGSNLTDQSYNIQLGLPFTKDSSDNITTEYTVSFLDDVQNIVGGIFLDYVKPVPESPPDDSTPLQPVDVPPIPIGGGVIFIPPPPPNEPIPLPIQEA